MKSSWLDSHLPIRNYNILIITEEGVQGAIVGGRGGAWQSGATQASPRVPQTRGQMRYPFLRPALRDQIVRNVGAAMKRGTICGPSFEVPVSIQRPTQGNILFGVPFEARRQRRPKSSGHGFNDQIMNLWKRTVGSKRIAAHCHGIRSSKQWVHALVLQPPPGDIMFCSSMRLQRNVLVVVGVLAPLSR